MRKIQQKKQFQRITSDGKMINFTKINNYNEAKEMK